MKLVSSYTPSGRREDGQESISVETHIYRIGRKSKGWVGKRSKKGLRITKINN